MILIGRFLNGQIMSEKKPEKCPKKELGVEWSGDIKK